MQKANAMDLSAADPKGLIRESYRIDGISDAECRSILIDWALSLQGDIDQARAIAHLLDHYGAADPDHPMTALLRAGTAAGSAQASRRGGRAARVGGRSA